jgi:hypothetical protein
VSIAALLKGVERQLRSEAVFDDRPTEEIGAWIGVQPGVGRPPPNAGQFYLSIHWGGGRGDAKSPNLRHDVYHGVICTLTARLNYAPNDRKGQRMAKAGDFYDIVDRVAAPEVIHGQPLVLQYANELIEGTQDWCNLQPGAPDPTVNGFVELLVLGPMGPERPASPDWVGTDKPVKDVYVADIRFADARRIQRNTSG